MLQPLWTPCSGILRPPPPLPGCCGSRTPGTRRLIRQSPICGGDMAELLLHPKQIFNKEIAVPPISSALLLFRSSKGPLLGLGLFFLRSCLLVFSFLFCFDEISPHILTLHCIFFIGCTGCLKVVILDRPQY